MKLYHSLRPHPRVGAGREVRMVLHEKGIDIPKIDLDMVSAENRTASFLSKNPSGQLPALELDDGSVIGESVAICELLEERAPTPALIGSTAEERAETRMWLRRIEFGISENIVNGWRFAEGQAFWATRGRTVPEAADGLKAIARDKLAWLDGLMTGKRFIVGERFTLVDIVLFVALDFAEVVGQPLDPALTNLAAWRSRVGSRASAEASLS
jgi:glutathione S-transferase